MANRCSNLEGLPPQYREAVKEKKEVATDLKKTVVKIEKLPLPSNHTCNFYLIQDCLNYFNYETPEKCMKDFETYAGCSLNSAACRADILATIEFANHLEMRKHFKNYCLKADNS